MPASQGPGAGALDEGYADRRDRSKPLRYRYKARANVAAAEFRQRHPRLATPKMLDLGAAEGRTLRTMRELLGPGGTYHGVEITTELVQAGKGHDEVTLWEGDVTRLPEDLQRNSYDLVTALAVLEHLPDAEAAVAEAFRMLKPGGMFVATCPNPFWDDVAARLGMLHGHGSHHERDYDLEGLTDLLERHGFVGVSGRRFMWAPVGFLPYMKFEPPTELALQADRMIERLGFLNFSFVNQLIAGQKP